MGSRRVDLQTAAELLGISSDAVRKRAKRGTLPYETGADGKLYVWVDDGEASDYPAGESPIGDRGELVEELRDRVRSLERQVEAEREANRENRRIIAALMSRIPEIEAPQERKESPQERQEASGGVEDHSSSEGPQTSSSEAPRSSWRQRVRDLRRRFIG